MKLAIKAFLEYLIFVLWNTATSDGTVLKQLQPPPRVQRELEFYNMVSESEFILYSKCFHNFMLLTQ